MTTTLVFIRHAKPSPNHVGPDSTCPLSKEGELIQERLAAQLEEEGIIPDTIYSSPLLRAVQSAKILADSWNIPVTEDPALGNDFDSDKILTIGRATPPNGKTLFFVGHEPTLALLANRLIGADILPAGLSKSGAVIMRFGEAIDDGRATDYIVLHPDEYRE